MGPSKREKQATGGKETEGKESKKKKNLYPVPGVLRNLHKHLLLGKFLNGDGTHTMRYVQLLRFSKASI